MKYKNRGFIALITAIIISAILLLLATNLSISGFYSRSNILDYELKEISFHLAEACIDQAISKRINNINYSPSPEIITIDNKECQIESVHGNIIKTKSNYKNYITHLEVEIDPSDRSIVRFEEI